MSTLKNNFEFMLDSEISKEIAKKLQAIRKKRFKTQEDFKSLGRCSLLIL